MQQPLPHHQPPPQGYPAPPGDRLKLPLLLLIVGCVGAMLRSTTNLVVVSLARASRLELYSSMAAIQVLFAVAVGGLFVAGCAMIAAQRRPGHALAMGTAIAVGINVVLSFVFLASRVVGTPLTVVSAVMSTGVVIALSMTLRELAKSRQRQVEPLVFAAIGITCLSFTLWIAGRAGLRLGDPGRYLSTLLTFAQYGALIGAAARIMSFVPPAELVMGDPSAYRGPQGAYTQPTVVPGSLALGFCAGLFGGCIGLGLVLVLAKGPATKRGAGLGFACQTFVGIVLRATLR